MAAANIDVVEIATQVVEAIGTIVSAYASFKLLEVARDNYNLWKEQREYYYNTFQYGVEKPLAAEIFAVGVRQLDYSQQAATIYDANTGPLGGDAGDSAAWLNRHAAMYNTLADQDITEAPVDLARLKSDWANYLFRFEEHDVDVFNDVRWGRRIAIHNIGIKQGTAISSALATSFSAYEDSMNDTADQFAQIANGAAAYAGYRRGMTDTYDDFSHYGYRQNKPQTQTFGIDNSNPVSVMPL